MKKYVLIAVSMIVMLFVVSSVFGYLVSAINSNVLEDLKGQIYYKKRVDGVNELFTANADLSDEKLVYSHSGKGRDNYDGFNDNILEYHVDPESGDIEFVAMNEGEWSLFSLPFGEKDAVLLGKAEYVGDQNSYMENVDYLKKKVSKQSVLSQEGSIYILENGKQKIIKKFWGIYDSKFNGGYVAVGFSPDGNYLIYHFNGHLTPIGTLIDGMLTGDVGRAYIMNLKTGKSTRYLDITDIQWLP